MFLKEFITTSYNKEIYLDIKKYSMERSKIQNIKTNSISVPKNKFSLKLKDTYHQFMIKCILWYMFLKECSLNAILSLNHTYLHSSPKSFLKTPCRLQTLRPSGDLQGTSWKPCVIAGRFEKRYTILNWSIYDVG